MEILMLSDVYFPRGNGLYQRLTSGRPAPAPPATAPRAKLEQSVPE